MQLKQLPLHDLVLISLYSWRNESCMTLLNPGPALNADYRNLSSASFCGGSTAGFLCLDLPYHNEVSFVMPQPKKKKWSRKGYSVTCVRLSTYMYVDPKLGFHTVNYQCFWRFRNSVLHTIGKWYLLVSDFSSFIWS